MQPNLAEHNELWLRMPCNRLNFGSSPWWLLAPCCLQLFQGTHRLHSKVQHTGVNHIVISRTTMFVGIIVPLSEVAKSKV